MTMNSTNVKMIWWKYKNDHIDEDDDGGSYNVDEDDDGVDQISTIFSCQEGRWSLTLILCGGFTGRITQRITCKWWFAAFLKGHKIYEKYAGNCKGDAYF